MIPRKATAVIFLCFSIVVAFYNLFLARFEYLVFPLPFLVALIFQGRYSRIAELAGIYLAAFYVMLTQIVYVGIMGMLVAAVMFFTLGFSLVVRRIYLYGTTLAVGICSYIHAVSAPSPFAKALLEAGVYGVCAICIYIALQYYALDAKHEKPLTEKCMDTLDTAVSVAQEAIKIAKRGDKHG